MFKKRPYTVTVLRALGGIGDLLMMTPTFLGFKEKYGRDCRVIVGTSWAYFSGSLPMLLRNNPNIDDIVRVEPFEFAPWGLKYARAEFRGVPNAIIPNCVIDTDEVHDLNTICAITETNTQPNVTKHRTDIWCDAAHVNPSCKKPILNLTKEEMKEGKDWADKNIGDGVRVGIVLKAHDPARTWPYAMQLVQELDRVGYKVFTIDQMNRAYDHIPAILGKTIRQTASILAHAHGVITPDSGILHVAGTMGTPVVGLFGPTNGALRMREYAGVYVQSDKLIECAPCWYMHPCRKDRNQNNHYVCMKRLSIPIVTHELENMLTKYGVTLPSRHVMV